jgi:RNA polymerase sigma factor (sigma-70 family)
LKLENTTSSFEQLIVRHQHLIRKICSIYGKSEADKADLFQEITIQLWKSFPAFEHRSKFSTWLYRVALNTAITQKRKEKRNPISVSLTEKEMRIPEPKGTDTDEEDIIKLRSAIRRLKKVERAIIFLYLEEKSYREIADIIGITPKNVGVKIVRIKAKLLTILTSSHGK